MKRHLSLLLALLLTLSITVGCSSDKQESSDISTVDSQSSISETTEQTEQTEATVSSKYAGKTAEEIVASLTLEQKAAQMVQPAVYAVTPEQMQENCYGSILSKIDSVKFEEWQQLVDSYQTSALQSEAGVPYLFGQDDVHGVNYCSGAVIFPHNIGIGAANDPDLTYQMGLATADEAKLCHMLWTFSPCVAHSADPRWGRTYESYGADLDIIESLGTSYTKGLVDGGLVACAKHYFGDGDVAYGSGENSDVQRIMDRGDSKLTDEQINDLLSVYKALVDSGVQTVMVSHSSLNGVKMHENAKYIQYLKNDMGFKGFIVSDWNSVQNTSAKTYKEQMINSVNAGIDMFMEVEKYDEAMGYIIEGVNEGTIPQERVDDAATRIIKVKLDEGIFDDPMCTAMETKQKETGSDEYRQLAEKLVEESLVLVKNDNNVLPIKKGMTVYVTGPACDDAVAQCGGWTLDWNQSPIPKIPGVKTILKGFKKAAEKYGITVTTNSLEAKDADCVVLVVGEQSYAEWNGDTEDLKLCGALGLDGNQSAIDQVEALGKPTIACIVAGRQVIIDDYKDKWDGIVMCYLPGSEGQGVADVLCGDTDFKGKLPSPWYSSVDQIGTDKCWLEKGYGLTYNN